MRTKEVAKVYHLDVSFSQDTYTGIITIESYRQPDDSDVYAESRNYETILKL